MVFESKYVDEMRVCKSNEAVSYLSSLGGKGSNHMSRRLK